jgi:hypothetical protein
VDVDNCSRRPEMPATPDRRIKLPGVRATYFDATPGTWSTRGDDSLDRKSARMQRDYEIAAMMTGVAAIDFGLYAALPPH